MAALYNEWMIQLYNRRTGQIIDDDSGVYIAMTGGSPTRATIYSDKALSSSVTQPGTMTNGMIRFFTASSVSSLDISILTATGRAYFLESCTPSTSTHRADVDPEKQEYQFICNFHANTACDAVADTGVDLVAGMRVKDVWLHVTTAIATGCLISVGVSGDTSAQGFLFKANAGATGYKFGNVVYTTNGTDVANSAFVSSVQVRGGNLVDYSQGLTTASTGASKGFFAPKKYMVTAATSLVWTLKVTNTAGTGEGYIYVEYDLAPTQGN